MRKLKRSSGAGRLRTIVSVILMIGGLVLAGYPFASSYVFENRKLSEISVYDELCGSISDDLYEEMMSEAVKYNEELKVSRVKLGDPFSSVKESGNGQNYGRLLDIDGSGIMGYIKIPCIGLSLPVFHGTSDYVLKRGAGHLEGSSLPVGGKGCHAVLTGHSGVNTARLFTDLSLLREGDLVTLHVLDEVLYYRVCGIETVMPDETDSLQIIDGQDVLTLVTCTPYGVNSHRLLVHCLRFDEAKDSNQDMANEEAEIRFSDRTKTYMRSVFAGIAITVSGAGLILVTEKLFRNIIKFKDMHS